MQLCGSLLICMLFEVADTSCMSVNGGFKCVYRGYHAMQITECIYTACKHMYYKPAAACS